ncbi:DUF3048 domain-containing protein [Microbacterium oleivorans]|uniref:DUF3048 domain-containing protein n=1 Tax=Microbacterium oleivorans TaxID=273677 RepID=UPI000976653C|nr:DUF3048 domain-containing protein [Microbacterium oleivorans]
MTRLAAPRLSALVILAVLAGPLSACTPSPEASGTPSPVATSERPQSTPTPTPPPPPTTVSAPLRGTEMSVADARRPALSVKIDNHYDARPQYGIDRADIVVEELVEGGLTRYVATWHSDLPAEVGPVRSIRPMDPDIVSPLGGIIAYSGGRAQFVSMMQKSGLHNAVHGGADDRFMYRTGERRAPHNVILKAPQLVAAYDDLAAPKAQFRYTETGAAPLSGTKSAGIDLTFSRVSPRSWTWDQKSSTYVRSQHGRADTAAGGTRIAATNVLVLRVSIDGRYGDVPKTVLVGSGKGTLSTGGYAMPVVWSKESRTAPIVLKDAAGSEVPLGIGKTWVELVPTAGGVAIR